MVQYTTKTAVVIAAAVAALTACSEPAASTDLPQNEQRYINGVYDQASEQGVAFPYGGEEHVLELGYAACHDLKTTDPSTLIRQIQNVHPDTTGSPAPVAQSLVGGAELHLCPDVGDDYADHLEGQSSE